MFLATIPFLITSYLASLKKLYKFGFALAFFTWLAFLPNAPYIITDLMHLRLKTNSYLWLDILVVTSFALNGMLLLYLSVLDITILLKPYVNNRFIKYGTGAIFFLCGLGIYLGRFLRYNSWEIALNPKPIIHDLFHMLSAPNQNKEAWLFTLLFGAFLNIGFWMFNTIHRVTLK
ncbi:hypothetical protein GCM10022395_19270 [Snuella lapsa]|uniref:DUF1361 domain-containing protein n=1 Tax=Snuella lapsa TaxID=870481 RepID=A0ABP6XNP7_9FLAO